MHSRQISIFLICTTIYPTWQVSGRDEKEFISFYFRTFVRTYENYENCSVQDLYQIDEEFV